MYTKVFFDFSFIEFLVSLIAVVKFVWILFVVLDLVLLSDREI